jgi:transcriptional regulator with XRE-family HTH domain
MSIFCIFAIKYYKIMSIGNNIKKVRAAKDLSQKEVAVSCNIDPAQYSRIETGKTDPSFSTIEKIAKAFGIEAY